MSLPLAVSRPLPSRPPGDRAAAACEIAGIESALAAAGRSVLDELGGPLEPGRHYPPGEVWDSVTHAQYFFHAHSGEGRGAAESGHFHCFLGQAGMAPGMSPLVLPEMAMAPAPSAATRDIGTHRSLRDRGVFSHLIAVSVDGAGRPTELFTTNRWVTGETWYRAEDVLRMLDAFDFPAPGPSALADRWLAAVLRLLRPPIAELILARDLGVMDWRRRRSRHHHVFEDRRLEVVSRRRVDFAAELAAAVRLG